MHVWSAGASVGDTTSLALEVNAGGDKSLITSIVTDITGGARKSDITFTPGGSGAFTGVERMRITNQGNVGIGTTNPTAKLEIGGAAGNVGIGGLSGTGNRLVYSDSNGTLTNSSSDIRLKTNIERITNTVDPISLLKDESIYPIYYNWKTDILCAYKELGFTAQMFEGKVEGLVGINATGMKSLNYEKIPVLLWEQNKQLLKRLETNEAQLASALNRIEILELKIK